ncbi:Protein root UVB sensitive 4 [Striga hermonthica]|uniref:Protein root UVB sensitive 4 n=1 Tax=Striga hermonthica TaxID=68872 RepID=A0A9N7MMT8_STRHE|nr:Protein root UVB sensitive 4 [Striga hermonthica]
MKTINPPSHSQFCASWARCYDPMKKVTKSFKPKTSLKPSAFSKSLSTSFNFNHEYREQEKPKLHQLNDESPEILNLPVVIRRSGRVSGYFWDGKELKLASVDEINVLSLSNSSLNFEGEMRKLSRVCVSAVRNFFLPREVSDNYLEYVKWKFLHRVFSSALQVLATQAMFRAIGIGYSRSLPSAAALNWVLKDGLGRLSRCIYTASLASAFDTNLKRVRFATSFLFSLSIGVELLTPIFPKYFLLLATLANIAKQISLGCHLATGSAVHRSFAIADNLGEVSAKAQIQTVCFDNVGLLLSATLNIMFRNNQRLLAALPFVVYPIFSGVDLYGIYQGLKHVHLQTLTKDRLESILKIWIQLRYIPSPDEVSTKEGIGLLWRKDSELLPVRIGILNPKKNKAFAMSTLSMMTLKSLKDEDSYFICLESLNYGSRIMDHGILICLREGAQTSDVIMGLLQACYLRNRVLLDTISWEKILETCQHSNSFLREWFLLLEESKRSAEADLYVLIDKMSGLGWSCKNVLLSMREQERYSFVADG